jgi:hypothetical protein
MKIWIFIAFDDDPLSMTIDNQLHLYDFRHLFDEVTR